RHHGPLSPTPTARSAGARDRLARPHGRFAASLQTERAHGPQDAGAHRPRGVWHGEREGIAVPYRGTGFTMTHPPQPPFEGLLALPGRRRPVLRYTIAAIVLLLIIVPAIASRLSDWLWYQDIGFERVFLTKIIAQWVLGLAAGVGGFIFLYVNARIALRGVPTRNLHIRDANAWAQAGPKVLIERLAVWFVLPVTTALALILALNSAGNWRDLAQYFYRTPFGVVDPIFGRDVAYYVFTIPMVENVLAFANAILWMALIMALPIYLVRTDVGIASGFRGQQLDVKQLRFYVTPRAQMHLAI